MDNSIFLGKKVFFLYPHSVIKEELLRTIIKNEYEVYLLREHKKVPQLLALYPNSILFINIDEGLRESDWENFIKDMMADETTKDVRIGILSYGSDQDLIQKYLMEIMVPCGFIRLKLGLAESTKIILKTLEVNEAKGRRKYVRVQCDESTRALFNIRIADKVQTGRVLDLSSVGMACLFDDHNVILQPKSVLKDIQLRLKGTISMVNGVVFGSREGENSTIWVLLFTRDIDDMSRNKIHDFISHTLQNAIDNELKKIK